jgi:S-adenosylmethionine:tRNA ribosyltransferase-isomerase
MSRAASGRPSFPTAELDYALPAELIAQTPPPRREDARMLVVDRATDELHDRTILDLPDFLRAGDVLVLNDTKVLPAKFLARRATGGVVGGLFLEEEAPGLWRVLLEGSRRLRAGERLEASPLHKGGGRGVEFELLERLDEGQWRVAVHAEGSVEQILARIGQTPLPPYIRRPTDEGRSPEMDRERYQTVYAKVPGAVAAPTAGLHLTDPILDRIREGSIEITSVTLHVGLGTFKPVMVDDLADHVMHSERYEISAESRKAIWNCRARGGRIVAVGTTSVRVLETIAPSIANRQSTIDNSALRGSTELLIYPPYRFRLVDALLTNFHLPRSTLLALVMAFAGIEHSRDAYAHAITERYRFYSYGDAMLIV